MQVFNTITNLQNTLENWQDKGNRVAFVPTMGGLHQGHLSLIELAKKNADRVVVHFEVGFVA